MLSKTYEWTDKIMLKHDVYKPINSFLKQKGFEISSYALEKMAEIPKSKQEELGFENIMLVPSPLAININVETVK